MFARRRIVCLRLLSVHHFLLSGALISKRIAFGLLRSDPNGPPDGARVFAMTGNRRNQVRCGGLTKTCHSLFSGDCPASARGICLPLDIRDPIGSYVFCHCGDYEGGSRSYSSGSTSGTWAKAASYFARFPRFARSVK